MNAHAEFSHQSRAALRLKPQMVARFQTADLSHVRIDPTPVLCLCLSLCTDLIRALAHAGPTVTGHLVHFLRHLATLRLCLHCPPFLPAVPPTVRCGN